MNYMESMRAQLAARKNQKTQAGFTLIDIIVCVVFILALSVVGLIAYRTIIKNAREQNGELDGTPAPQPLETQPVQTPVSGEPLDLTMFWTVLAILGGLAVLALIVFLLVMVIRKNKLSAEELRARRLAAEEDHRKALGVWQKFVGLHGSLKAKALEIETDWDMLFSYPALVDASVPQTRDFHRALRAADVASSEPPAELNLSMAINELTYPKLVEAADEAWRIAWDFAKKTGTKLIPREERKKINQILKLLKLARDAGGSNHERAVAYERASKLVSELHFVKVPEVALKSIGAETRLALETLNQPKAEAVSSPNPTAIPLG